MLPGLEQLLTECAPNVAPDTMSAIVRVESGGNPIAMNVNGGQRLARQPANRDEALAWATWLIAHGYSVDLGMAQVNSRNLPRLGVTAEQMFEPCDNLKAGARILAENYAGASKQYGEGQKALRAAISAYNTGNYKNGFTNGYVAKVDASAGVESSGSVPPLITGRAAKHKVANVVATVPVNAIAPAYRAVHAVHPRSREPRVFVYGHRDENRRSTRDSDSPQVSWVKK